MSYRLTLPASPTLAQKFNRALESAKHQALACPRVGALFHVCLVRDYGTDDYEVLNRATYEETGSESACKASVWSYRDGRYTDDGRFIENGRLAVAVERY